MKYEFSGLFDLTGRVAVVTGGAGILGSVFCRALAQYGARVAVVDLHEQPARELADEICVDHPGQAIGIACDVADSAAVDAMMARVVDSLGAPDILLNNAASKSDNLEAFFAPFENYEPAEWRRVMDVNLDGVFLVAKAFLGSIAPGRPASIIQTSSIYGLVGADQRIYEGSQYLGVRISNPAVYSASKAAVIGLTRHLAAEWGARGVRVNALVPGGVSSGQNQTFVDKYSARVPLGRMARMEEMVGAVLFLASEASSYVTGHVLVVDGGLTAW